MSVTIFAEAGWRLRLHAPGLDATAAMAALRELLAGRPSAIGFAVLRRQRGGLLLAVHRWTAFGLERDAVLVPPEGGPGRPWPALPGGLGAEAEFRLIAREAAAWQRHVLLAERPDADAYLAAA